MEVLKQYINYEETIKGSRFLSELFPCSSQAEARELVKSQKAKYADATHVVHAFVIGPGAEVMGMSDDGEPSGTAGRPALDVLRGRGCTNTVLTITRWFGGTLLGTGGLVRAYTDASKEALSAAELHTVMHIVPVITEYDYTDVGRIDHMLISKGYDAEAAEFTDKVTRTIYVPFDEVESFHKAVTETTSGRAVMLDMDEVYR